MKALVTALVIAGVAVGYAACFHEADFENGTITCSTDTKKPCPGGSYCIDNYCIRPDLLRVDAQGVDGAAFVDGGVDAGDDL